MKSGHYLRKDNPMTDNDKIIEPCPMSGCGGECKVYLTLDKTGGKQRGVHCTKCGYMSPTSGKFPDKAIAAHNQLCKLVAYGQRAIAACEKPPKQIINIAEHAGITEEKGIFNNGVQAMVDLLSPPSEVPGRGE